ncbi:MAG: pentapeptide repeat-containing protein, partial [Candidatus Omnitrophota bacterium]
MKKKTYLIRADASWLMGPITEHINRIKEESPDFKTAVRSIIEAIKSQKGSIFPDGFADLVITERTYYDLENSILQHILANLEEKYPEMKNHRVKTAATNMIRRAVTPFLVEQWHKILTDDGSIYLSVLTHVKVPLSMKYIPIVKSWAPFYETVKRLNFLNNSNKLPHKHWIWSEEPEYVSAWRVQGVWLAKEQLAEITDKPELKSEEIAPKPGLGIGSQEDAASADRDMAKLEAGTRGMTLEDILESKLYSHEHVSRVRDILRRYSIPKSRTFSDVLRDRNIKPYVKWKLHEVLIDDFIRSFYAPRGKNKGKWRHYGDVNGEYEELGKIKKFFEDVLQIGHPLSVLKDLTTGNSLNSKSWLNVLDAGGEKTVFDAHASPTFGINISSSCGDMGGAIVHELMALSGFTDDDFNEEVETAYRKWRDSGDSSVIPEIREEIEKRNHKPGGELPDQVFTDFTYLEIDGALLYSPQELPSVFLNMEELTGEVQPLIEKIEVEGSGVSSEPATVEDEVFGRVVLKSAEMRRAEENIAKLTPRIIATCGSGNEQLRNKAKEYLIYVFNNCSAIDLNAVLFEFYSQGIPIPHDLKRAFNESFLRREHQRCEDAGLVIAGNEKQELDRIFKYASIFAQRAVYFDVIQQTNLADQAYKEAYRLFRLYLEKMAIVMREELTDGEPCHLNVFDPANPSFLEWIGALILKLANEKERFDAIGIKPDEVVQKYLGVFQKMDKVNVLCRDIQDIEFDYPLGGQLIAHAIDINVSEITEGEFEVLAREIGQWERLISFRENFTLAKEAAIQAESDFFETLLLSSKEERDWAKANENAAGAEDLENHIEWLLTIVCRPGNLLQEYMEKELGAYGQVTPAKLEEAKTILRDVLIRKWAVFVKRLREECEYTNEKEFFKVLMGKDDTGRIFSAAKLLVSFLSEGIPSSQNDTLSEVEEEPAAWAEENNAAFGNLAERELLRKFANYDGTVYYPFALDDLQSVFELAGMFPKAGILLNDAFIQKETDLAESMPDRNNMEEVSAFLEQQFMRKCPGKVSRVDFRIIDEAQKLLEVTVQVTPETAKSIGKETVIFRYQAGFFEDLELQTGVILVKRPGYGGRFSTHPAFWEMIYKKLTKPGFVLIDGAPGKVYLRKNLKEIYSSMFTSRGSKGKFAIYQKITPTTGAEEYRRIMHKARADIEKLGLGFTSCMEHAVVLREKLRTQGINTQLYVRDARRDDGNKTLHFYVKTKDYMLDVYPAGVIGSDFAMIQPFIKEDVIVLPLSDLDKCPFYAQGAPVEGTKWEDMAEIFASNVRRKYAGEFDGTSAEDYYSPPTPAAGAAEMDLWKDKRVVEIEKDLEESGLKNFRKVEAENAPPRIQKIIICDVAELYEHKNGLRIVRKKTFGWNPDAIKELCLAKQPWWCPTFSVEGDELHYFELDLTSFGYLTLNEITGGKAEDLTSDIRDAVKRAVSEGARQGDNLFIHKHLHAGNILIKLDDAGNVLDVRLIDLKLLQRARISDYKGLMALLDGKKDWKGSDLTAMMLEGFDFRGFDLSRAVLRYSNLAWADLRGVNMANARLWSSNLTGADLRGAILEGANLIGVIFEWADLRGARLEGADLSEAKFVNARFNIEDMRRAKLRQTMFNADKGPEFEALGYRVDYDNREGICYVTSPAAGTIPPSGVKEIYVSEVNANRESSEPRKLAPKEMRELMSKFTEGKLIFNAKIESETLRLGITADAQHEAILYPSGISFVFRGIASSYDITFVIEGPPLSRGAIYRKYYEMYIRLARVFVENGFPGSFKLSSSVVDIIKNYDMFRHNVPRTVGELARQPLMTDGSAKYPSIEEVRSFLAQRLTGNYAFSSVDVESFEDCTELVKRIVDLGIRKVLVVGSSMAMLPHFLYLLGIEVVYVDMEEREIKLTNGVHRQIVDDARKEGLTGEYHFRAIHSEIGELDLEKHGLEAGSFDLVTLIDLAAKPEGDPGKWLLKAKNLLRSPGYILTDKTDWSEFGYKPMMHYFSEVFRYYQEISREDIIGTYGRVDRHSINGLYKVNMEPGAGVEEAEETQLAEMFTELAEICREKMRTMRHDIEKDNYDAVRSAIRQIHQERERIFAGPSCEEFRFLLQDSSQDFVAIQLLLSAGGEKEALYGCLDRAEAVLAELEKLMAAGRLRDAGKACVSSGVLDASLVLDPSKAPEPPAAEEKSDASWGKDVPSLEIPFSQDALKYQREHSAEAAAYTGPFITIYRGVPEFLFERMKEYGFEKVPDWAYQARMRRKPLAFEDDFVIHSGRLACSGNFRGAQGNRNLQLAGTMLFTEVPAGLLLDERVLIFDKDAAEYLHELIGRESAKGRDSYEVQLSLRDRGTKEAKELVRMAEEAAGRNREELRRLLAGSPGKVPRFISGKGEIIIPYDLLNLFLGKCGELPVHVNHNYFTVQGKIDKTLDPIYIPDFWEPVLE